MKKVLSRVPAFILAFVLCAALITPVAAKANDGIVAENVRNVKIKKMKKQTLYEKAGKADLTLEISYPVFNIIGDPDATKVLNRQVRKEFVTKAVEFYQDPAINGGLEEGDKLTVLLDCEQTTDYRCGNCLSVVCDGLCYLEGIEEPAAGLTAVQFDLTTGKKVPDKKLFNTKKLYRFIAKNVLEAVEKCIETVDGCLFYDDLKKSDIRNALEINTAQIFLDPDYLHVSFDEGVIAPHSSGIVGYKFDLDDVEEFEIARYQLLHPLGDAE